MEEENKVENLFTECLSSREGISSKRVATFVALITWVICVITELFTSYEVSVNTMDTLMYLVGFGLGATASEKFGRK